jgi:uncharacterized small protein (DUF1192 family)
MTVINEKAFTKENEVAVIQLLDTGRIAVVKNGGHPTLYHPRHTFDEVTQTFTKAGWETLVPVQKAHEAVQGHTSDDANGSAYMQTVMRRVESATKQNVPPKTVEEVDEYIALHEQISQLKSQLEKKKKGIRSYMESNNLKEIVGTQGKKVYLQDCTASNATSIFTDYELIDLSAVMEQTYLEEVTETRVNGEKLEALLKLDKLPKDKVNDIKKLKIQNAGTPRFSVKKA